MGLFSALFGGGSSRSKPKSGGGQQLSSTDARRKIHHVVDGLYRAKRFSSLDQKARDVVIAKIGALVQNGGLKYRERSNQSKAILKICADAGLDSTCGQMIRDRVLAIFE